MALNRGTTDVLMDPELERLLGIFPSSLSRLVYAVPQLERLVEVVVDLGRLPEARFDDTSITLGEHVITHEDLTYITGHLSSFGRDNRAGIEQTLHRISAIRNRSGTIIGLTCRVGRSVTGTLAMITDVIRSGKSICLLGRPGVGKTTMLRECARLLAEERRVVIIDTSNEIAGDGDVPHRGIGRARRMQVADPALQHAVMIEAVENHMPQVIVIDEIGTEAEALAARTIAERGVQLIGTAHGRTLENLLMNPTLSDLVGGIATVTLSDEEARRRSTRKTVLERRLPPTFEVVIEILERDEQAIHLDVAGAVDAMLRGVMPQPEVRKRLADGGMHVVQEARSERPPRAGDRFADPEHFDELEGDADHRLRIFPYGVSRNKIERAIRSLGVNAAMARKWDEADLVITLRSLERKDPARLRAILSEELPVYAIKTNTTAQILHILEEIFEIDHDDTTMEEAGVLEATDAIQRVVAEAQSIELAPQNSYVRRLQHQLAERSSVQSCSVGSEPNRRVRIYRGYDGSASDVASALPPIDVVR